jgi:hypothetical protein
VHPLDPQFSAENELEIFSEKLAKGVNVLALFRVNSLERASPNSSEEGWKGGLPASELTQDKETDS